VSSSPSTCAICGKGLEADAVASSPLYPFCSRRCKEIDLLRWCDGRYAVVNDMDPDMLLELEENQPDAPYDGE
jgi:endogenous inhibitor of DNA gyrase (YacG/DUF329 family)